MTADNADYARWGRYASAEVEEEQTPVRSPWGADASADLDLDEAHSTGREGLWGEGESADEFEYADDVEVEDVATDRSVEGGTDGVEAAARSFDGGVEAVETGRFEAASGGWFEAPEEVGDDAEVAEDASFAAAYEVASDDAVVDAAVVDRNAANGAAGEDVFADGAAADDVFAEDEAADGAAADDVVAVADAEVDASDVWVDDTEAAEDVSFAAAEDVVAVAGQGAVVTSGFVSTGHEAVDAAVRAVENAARLPVGEQLAAYEAAHTTLREVLGSIEE